ncbi:MAG: translocase [Planctomycetaceae bacterium]
MFEPLRRFTRGLWPGTITERRQLVGQVIAESESLASASDEELRLRGVDLKWLARSGVELDSLLVRAYGLMREACHRTLKLRHYPVQIEGAIAIFQGGLAEMQTGEGKTLTAVLPTYLRALIGQGCHVVTVNDYLALRDAELNRAAFELLSMTVGCIQTPQGTDERRAHYSRDVTYGTSKELGFDFLRDRLRLDDAADAARAEGAERPVQRGHYFALVDEADSVLIDDARTPLIISTEEVTPPASLALYEWGSQIAPQLIPEEHFLYDPHKRDAVLTEAGCRKVLLSPRSSLVSRHEPEQIYRQVERALTAQYGFQRDRDYVINDDQEIQIIDESTGRMMEGRKWQQGLHQAIEAKEQVPITNRTMSAAQVTVQRYFRQYRHLGGMTGTASSVRGEVHKTYKMKVSVIPTHRPCIRQGLPTRVFATWVDKAQAVVQEVERLVSSRAVLIGTPSVAASEQLSQLLTERSIVHQLLNARKLSEEADIISRAGRRGHVTIATNMAGRGTDILLDENVRESGGLHVIATEMHSSARIDRQLVGRAARQGDPGSFQFFVSLDDELLNCLRPRELERHRRQARSAGQSELPASFLQIFTRAQKRTEKLHLRNRKLMLKQEDQRFEHHLQMGLDPFLELIDEPEG